MDTANVAQVKKGSKLQAVNYHPVSDMHYMQSIWAYYLYKGETESDEEEVNS